MQESEKEDNGAWESHWKKVGAGAGTRKTCIALRTHWGYHRMELQARS